MKNTPLVFVVILTCLGWEGGPGTLAAPELPSPPRGAQVCLDEAHSCLASSCAVTQRAAIRWTAGTETVASIVALNQRVYAVDAARTTLLAFRAGTGERAWGFLPEGAIWILPPASRQDAAGRNLIHCFVFRESQPHQALYCLRDEGDRASVLWRQDVVWRTQDPMTLSGDRIFYFGYGVTRRLICLSAETGEEIFHRDLSQTETLIDNKPAVDPVLRHVFYRADGHLFCVDFDGNPRWQIDIPTGFVPVHYGVITVDVPARRLYFRTPRGRLRGYDSQTGALLWEYGVRVLDQVHGLVLSGPLLFVKEDTTPTAALVALDTATGQLVWRQPFPRPQLVGTRLLGTGASRLWAVDVAGGAPSLACYNRWTGQLLATSMASFEDFATDTDALYAVKAETHQLMRLSSP